MMSILYQRSIFINQLCINDENFATPREDWQRSHMAKQKVSLPNGVVDLTLCLFVLMFHHCIFILQTTKVGLKFSSAG